MIKLFLAPALLLFAASALAGKPPGGPCAAYSGMQQGQCTAWVAQNCGAQSPLSNSCTNILAHFGGACPAGQSAVVGPVPTCAAPSFTCKEFMAAIGTLGCDPGGVNLVRRQCDDLMSLVNATPACAPAFQTYFQCAIPNVATDFTCIGADVVGDNLSQCHTDLVAVGSCVGIQIQ